jgi:hypothetical protein
MMIVMREMRDDGSNADATDDSDES